MTSTDNMCESNNEKKELLSKLNENYDEIKELLERRSQYKLRLNVCIKERAFFYEKLFILEGREDEIHTIASKIIHDFWTHESSVYKTLKQLGGKYHRKYNTKKKVEGSTFEDRDSILEEKELTDIFDTLEQHPEYIMSCLSRRGIQEVMSRFDKLREKVIPQWERALDEYNMPRIGYVSNSQEQKPKREGTISLEAGDPITNEETLVLAQEWIRKLIRNGELKIKIAQDMKNYMTSNPDTIKRGIKQADAEYLYLEPQVNNKFVADHWGWISAIEQEKGFSDQIGREWRTKYEMQWNGKVRAKNPLVKEQVEARWVQMCNNFQFIAQYILDDAIFDNWTEAKQPKLLKRNKKLKPKLEESAFGRVS